MADRVLEDTKTPNSPGLPGACDHCGDVFHGALSKPLNQRKLANSLPESGASSSTASRALCQSGTEVVDTLLMGRTYQVRRQPISPSATTCPVRCPAPGSTPTMLRWSPSTRTGQSCTGQPPKPGPLPAPARAVDLDEPPPL
jgi:hypothetical protein